MARIEAANAGATLMFECRDGIVSVAITSSHAFRFDSAGPTKTGHATVPVLS